jgi:hypothetical protein
MSLPINPTLATNTEHPALRAWDRVVIAIDIDALGNHAQASAAFAGSGFGV